MSPAAAALARTFQLAFAQLTELAKTSPGEAALLGQHIAAHLRSSLPQSFLLDTGPVARLEPEK
jgi:hypothetical protein